MIEGHEINSLAFIANGREQVIYPNILLNGAAFTSRDILIGTCGCSCCRNLSASFINDEYTSCILGR